MPGTQRPLPEPLQWMVTPGVANIFTVAMRPAYLHTVQRQREGERECV